MITFDLTIVLFFILYTRDFFTIAERLLDIITPNTRTNAIYTIVEHLHGMNVSHSKMFNYVLRVMDEIGERTEQVSRLYLYISDIIFLKYFP